MPKVCTVNIGRVWRPMTSTGQRSGSSSSVNQHSRSGPEVAPQARMCSGSTSRTARPPSVAQRWRASAVVSAIDATRVVPTGAGARMTASSLIEPPPYAAMKAW